MFDINSDILYSEEFEKFIHDFTKITRGEISLIQIAPYIEVFSRSVILGLLLKDPDNDSARACVQSLVGNIGKGSLINGRYQPNIPQEFLGKLLALGTTTFKLSQTNLSFLHKSYNVKVIVQNTSPMHKVTNITVKTRQEQLREDSKKKLIFNNVGRLPPQAIMLKMDESVMNVCVNAMGDLNRIIVEGNRANGKDISGYIKTKTY
jgi:hypothetical protein